MWIKWCTGNILCIHVISFTTIVATHMPNCKPRMNIYTYTSQC